MGMKMATVQGGMIMSSAGKDVGTTGSEDNFGSFL